MQNLKTSPPNSKFPVGWHAILNEFVQELLAVEYFYGEVVASVSMDRSPVHLKLRVFLHSEAPRRLRGEASTVLDQIHDQIHERSWATCCICGRPAKVGMVSDCGEHSDIQVVPFSALPSASNPAWKVADFHMLINAENDEMIRSLAGNQQQLDAASAFLQSYDAPEISQILAQAHSLRAILAIEEIMRSDRFICPEG